MVQSALGRNGEILQSEVSNCTYGCTYYGNNKGVKADWDDVYKIAGQTGLDSNDAMILNLVLHNKTFEGIITGDRDFKKAEEAVTPRDTFVWIV